VPALPFDYSPLPARPPLRLPGGARVAVYVLVNVEYFEPGKPALSLYAGTASFPVDPLNYGWRDYGPRVGIWRLFDLLDRLEIPATGALNSDVCDHYPEIIEAAAARNWAWVAHGKNNSTMQGAMEEAEERAYLEEMVETIERATGRRPQGWLGPSLTETEATPCILHDLGFTYVLDWGNDDQPYPLTSAERMIAVPYPSELHDIPMLVMYGWTGAEFAEAMIEQFDVLYEEGTRSGSVFGIGLHPFLVGQPFRIRHLERVLAHIAGHEDVWLTTSDEIAAAYLAAADAGGTPPST
jgi:peptidoglycan/xylan/chitin deacetylase (PgdA/CDA1 family)